MTAYVRQPKRTVAHCPYCRWASVYFEDNRLRLRHGTRAFIGVNAHIRRKHKPGTTRINGR